MQFNVTLALFSAIVFCISLVTADPSSPVHIRKAEPPLDDASYHPPARRLPGVMGEGEAKVAGKNLGHMFGKSASVGRQSKYADAQKSIHDYFEGYEAAKAAEAAKATEAAKAEKEAAQAEKEAAQAAKLEQAGAGALHEGEAAAGAGKKEAQELLHVDDKTARKVDKLVEDTPDKGKGLMQHLKRNWVRFLAGLGLGGFILYLMIVFYDMS